MLFPLIGMADESEESDFFSEVSDISYMSDLDNTPTTTKYDTSNGSPVEKDKFKIVHFNINSITAEGKLEALTDLCQTLNIHVLVISESKLDPTIPNHIIAIPGYHDPIRHDRSVNGRYGGGCMMYVLESLTFKHVEEKQSNHFEHVWVDVKVENITVAINCLYRPPNETAEDHELFLDVADTILNDVSNHQVDVRVFASDFNFGNCYCLEPQLDFKPLDNEAPELFSSYNFSQLIDIPTRVSRRTLSLIDLIFVDSHDLVEEYGILPEIADHAGVLLCLNVKLKTRKPTKKTILVYKDIDQESLKNHINNIDFENTVFNLPVHEQADKFTDILKESIKMFVPRKEITVKPNTIPWCNTYTRLLLRKKNRNYKLYRAISEKYKRKTQERDCPQEVITQLLNKKDKIEKNYKTASRESVKANRRAKNSFFNSVNSTMQNFEISANKKFKILTKLMNNGKYSSITTLINNGEMVENADEKSELLNNFFVSKAKVDDDDDEIPILDKDENITEVNNINTSPLEVAKIMRELKKSNISHCGIPGKYISLISTPLSFPLSKLLNNLFENGVFPSLWKISHVTAIFKYKGKKSDVANYRPISLLPTLSKICESIVHKRLLNHCLENDVITSKQAAYLKGDSTIQQLIYIVDKIKRQWTKGNLTHGIFLDVKAAFDKVWHKGLLAKLSQIGVGGELHTFLTSYLNGRQQSVVVDGHVSSVKPITAGVPQGSRLGPLLFIIYINDIIIDIESDILIFADDTSLLANGKTVEETRSILERDLARITKWAKKWKVSFGADKSEEIIFSRKIIAFSVPLQLNNEVIKRVKVHKHLGIFLSETLDWSHQIHYVCLRANRKLAVLRKVKMLNRKTLDVLYKITVRSVIDYALPVYYHSLKVVEKAKLDKIQYAAAKVVTGVYKQASRLKFNEELAWEEIKTRADFLGLSIFHKIAVGETRPLIKGCMPLRSPINTRLEYVQFPFKGMYYANSFFPYFTKKYNLVDREIRNKNIQDFKTSMSEKLKPSKRKHYAAGFKHPNSLLASIRLGRSELNAHKYRIGLAPTMACEQCDNITPESPIHFLTSCTHFTEMRRALYGQIEREFIPNFKRIPLKRQFEILVEGFEPDNFEMRKINAKIQKLTQTFIYKTKRFLVEPKPSTPPPPP